MIDISDQTGVPGTFLIGIQAHTWHDAKFTGPDGGATRKTEDQGSQLLVLTGLFGASVNAASGRAVMGWFPRDERGLALGIRQTAVPVGGASAAVVLPWLTDTLGVRAAFLNAIQAAMTRSRELAAGES